MAASELNESNGVHAVRQIPSDDWARGRVDVFGLRLDAMDLKAAVARIRTWANARESRFVCACNVHSVVASRTDRAFAGAVALADMALPDGAPVAWWMRRKSGSAQRRVAGPDLMWGYLESAAERAESIFLLGGSEATLSALQLAIGKRFPTLPIAGALSPPYRTLTAEEDDAVVKQINQSGASTVWVGLGCPKQELWMAAHRDRIWATQIGVGAAFDFHSGTVRRAPQWMQRVGLEWAHRLVTEPRRLWRRYMVTGFVFLGLCALDTLQRPSTDRRSVSASRAPEGPV